MQLNMKVMKCLSSLAMNIKNTWQWWSLENTLFYISSEFEFSNCIGNKMKRFFLSDNPYHCDCDILWFRDWLHSKGQNVVNLPKETRCNSTTHDQKPIVKLTNSSFSCSGDSHISTNNVAVLSMLLISMLTFFMYR